MTLYTLVRSTLYLEDRQTFWLELGTKPIHANHDLDECQLRDHDVIKVHLDSLPGGADTAQTDQDSTEAFDSAANTDEPVDDSSDTYAWRNDREDGPTAERLAAKETADDNAGCAVDGGSAAEGQDTRAPPR